jgi:hypothetical protein
MANKDHLEWLKQGEEVWNQWRKANPDIKPDLTGVDLTGADLREANLTSSDLTGANLNGADLTKADLTGATIGLTVFGNVDLSRVRGLDTVMHIGPSTIGIDTLSRSQGQIPGNCSGGWRFRSRRYPVAGR